MARDTSSATRRASPLFLQLLCAASAFAASASAQQPQCGAPGGPCGKSLPPGSPCARQPGFCQDGHHCARPLDAAGAQSTCRKVPAACGTKAVADPNRDWDAALKDPASNCCPGNAVRAKAKGRGGGG